MLLFRSAALVCLRAILFYFLVMALLHYFHCYLTYNLHFFLLSTQLVEAQPNTKSLLESDFQTPHLFPRSVLQETLLFLQVFQKPNFCSKFPFKNHIFLGLAFWLFCTLCNHKSKVNTIKQLSQSESNQKVVPWVSLYLYSVR